MKYMTKKTLGVLLTTILSLGLMAPAAMALTVDLRAAETTVTMPDGTVVPMWGYYIFGDATYDTPPFGPSGPPVIRATTADNLQINLTNELTNALGAQTSVVIPGQTATEASAMTPTWTNGTSGARAGNLSKRVRSFTHETAATATGIYSWSTLKAGTYLIQSGTHPGVQVPMGLYAVLIVDEVANSTAYTAQPGAININYNQDVVMLFSEVDPRQHLAVTNGDYGTAAYPTTMAAGYQTDYFLINGRPFSAGRSPIPAGASGDNILLRFLNAGLRVRQPVIQGGTFTLIAEDGNPFTAIGGNQQQYTQHSLDLVAGKTLDAIFTPTTGYYPVYDRRLGLVNGITSGGGMMTFLEVGAPTRILTITPPVNGNVQTTSLPGGIDSTTTPADLTESFLDTTEVTLQASAGPGSALTGWTVVPAGECQADPYGDCVVTMNGPKTVTATFTDFSGGLGLLTPNGGENIPVGSGYTIRWGAPVTDITFSLAYSFGAGTPWQSIATGVTGNQYVWTVPAGLPDRGPLFIAITGYDSTGTKTTTDISDASATRYANALTAPNGGESWANPGTETISWNSSLVPGTVSSIGLWYRTAPATAWQLITVQQSDSGSYNWAVPTTAPSTTAEVGIIFYDALGDPLYIDISDNPFDLN